MIKMRTLKEKYKNKRFYENGVEYDFRNITPEKLERIYNNNKNLRHLFVEQEEFVEVTPEVVLTPEQFDTMVKEVAKRPRKKK
jgi:hypothetical protein